jgi:hypothetical protein
MATSLSALATCFCCVPIVAGATAGGLASVASLAYGARPWLLGVAVPFVGLGFWGAYKPQPACKPGSASEIDCAAPSRRRAARLLLWTSTIIWVLAVTFPQWSAWLY